MRFGPPPGSTAIAPILTQKNTHLFAHPDDVDPWEIGNTGNVTSALKFGVTLDMIGISLTTEEQTIGCTDVLDPAVSLGSLFYKTPKGDVHELVVRDRATNAFHPADVEQFSRLSLTFNAYVSALGVPVGFFGRVWHKVLDRLGYNTLVPVTITGQIDLHTGQLMVVGKVPPHTIELVGYTLYAHRYNPNRRGRCPVMG